MTSGEIKYRRGQACILERVVLEIDKAENIKSYDGWITFKPLRARIWWVKENTARIGGQDAK